MRSEEARFRIVYVNQDGSARELSPAERAYLSEEFEGGDGGRPYVKSSYEARDGWGSISGFLLREDLPSRTDVLPVHPDYDAREKEFMLRTSDTDRDEVEPFETVRRKHLDCQCKRERLALMSANGG